MKKEIFRGVGTALVTPFLGGEIDYAALRVLIERQISAGIEALVIGGTTGEAATLGEGERYELFRAARDMVGGRAALIFGTGTNDTALAQRHTEAAEKIGCDGVLVVTPYYNKGTREGVIKHYEKIANSTNLPIILYNVPSRTGVDLPPESVERLAECDNIVAIKEASGAPGRLAALANIGNIALYAGNDADTLAVLRLGGAGVISVTSNLCPTLMRELTDSYFRGDEARAAEAERRLAPIIAAMFLDTNPAPIKFALSRLGLCSGELRLPMWQVDEAVGEKIATAIRTLWE